MGAMIRSERKLLVLCVSAVCLVATLLCPRMVSGEESARLSFALPEGVTLFYETKWTEEYYYAGMDIIQNQSYDVEMKLDSLTEEGNSRLSMRFMNATSSMVVRDNIQDWTPPVRLDGKSLTVDVAPNGKIMDIEWSERIPGVRRPEELKEVLAICFLELPDTVKQVGESWRKDIQRGELFEAEGEEGGRPEVRGWAEFTFKRTLEKLDIPVASLEVKSEADIYRPVGNGMLDGRGKGKAEYCLAIEGGYIIEMKQEFEIKGKITADDGEENETAIAQYYEMKLKKVE